MMKSKKLKSIFILFVLVLLIFITVNIWTTFLNVKTISERTIANQTLSVAEGLAEQIDKEAYKRYLETKDRGKDYQQIKLFLDDIRKKSGALYISIVSIDNPKFAKVMISSVPNDMTAIPVGGKATIPAYQVGQGYEGNVFYTGILEDASLGEYLIAGSPIYDTDGTIIGFFVIDVSADDVNDISGKVLESSMIDIILSALFIVISLLFFIFIERWYQKALQKEVGDTEDTYQSEFQSLIASVHSLRHDFSNHIQVVHGLLKLGENEKALEYLTALSKESHSITSMKLNVNNPGLSVLLETKRLSAQNYNIDMMIDVSNDAFDSIKSTDLIKILSNVIDNAMEATIELPDDERMINIVCKSENHKYIFYVKNTGQKINEENKDLIFKRGFSTKRVQQGKERGQGLFIVKDLINKYNGEIGMISNEKNTSITIEIPVNCHSEK